MAIHLLYLLNRYLIPLNSLDMKTCENQRSPYSALSFFFCPRLSKKNDGPKSFHTSVFPSPILLQFYADYLEVMCMWFEYNPQISFSWFHTHGSSSDPVCLLGPRQQGWGQAVQGGLSCPHLHNKSQILDAHSSKFKLFECKDVSIINTIQVRSRCFLCRMVSSDWLQEWGQIV